MKFQKIDQKSLRSRNTEKAYTEKDVTMVQIVLTFPVLTDALDDDTIAIYLETASQEVQEDECNWVNVLTSPVTKADIKDFDKKNPDWYLYNPNGNGDDIPLSDIK